MTIMKLMSSAADPDRSPMRECRHSNLLLRTVAAVMGIVVISSVIAAVRRGTWIDTLATIWERALYGATKSAMPFDR